jgi:hypothetical protein
MLTALRRVFGEARECETVERIVEWFQDEEPFSKVSKKLGSCKQAPQAN